MTKQLGSVISTHTLRKEGDFRFIKRKISGAIFQPTPSARRVTSVLIVLQKELGFQPTPSARRVTMDAVDKTAR